MVVTKGSESASAAFDTLGWLFACDPKQDSQVWKLLDELAEMDVDVYAAEWPYVDSSVSTPLVKGLQEGAAGDWDVLAKEYRRLFVGPNALQAPPYGSVYTDPDQVLFGESTLTLRAWLDQVGIGVSSDEVAPEDHIGTMLSLLAWIMHVKPQLVEEYLSKHLLTWAPHYLEELEEAAGEGFYRSLAALTRLTLLGMQEQLGISIDMPRFYR